MPTSTLFRADVGIRPYNPYTTMSLRTSDRGAPRSGFEIGVLACGKHTLIQSLVWQSPPYDGDSHASVRTGSE